MVKNFLNDFSSRIEISCSIFDEKRKNDMANKICEQKLILGNSSSLKKKKRKRKNCALRRRILKSREWMDILP